MASGATQNDMTICSICFEKFKTPIILPCTHIFCHSCISSYILSSCKSKETPVGFSCPLCREFVPAPAAFDKPDKWAKCFPVCDIIEKFVKIRDSNLCLPCQREEDEEVPTDICITCEEPICGNCAKYHKRNLTSRTHLIVPVNSMETSTMLKSFISAETNSYCPEHPDKQIELHCSDHQKPCCSLCAGTIHRKCSNVESIKQVTEKAKKQGFITMWLNEMNTFEKRLHTIKESQEDNLTQIESSSDTIKEEIKNLKRKINDHLDRLEDEHLNELSKITKQSRGLLSATIDSVSDRIHFSRHCIQSLQNLENVSDACFMKEYYHVIESFKELKTATLKVHDMKLESSILKEAYEITNLKYISALSVVHSKHGVLLDIVQFSLCPTFEFDIPNDDVYCGDLSSNGTLTLAKYGSSKSGLQQYKMNSDNCKPTKEYRTENCFFGLVVNDDFIYATNRNENNVTIISSKTFTLHGKISVDEKLVPYGICQWKEYLFVACQTAILKYSISGRFIQSYTVDFNSLFVTVLRSGNIVYSNTSQNCVKSMDQNGYILWKYANAKLKSPHGVDKDETDDLYVSSTDMNNVHILSCDGSLVRIIEDIPRPIFMKVQESTRICCVCSNFRKFKVYLIK